MPKLGLDQREGNFREVELGLDETAAQAEAKRCLRCDLEWLDRVGLPRPTAATESAAPGEATP